MPKNVRDLGKLFVAKGFTKVPKVQKIAQSGHTGGTPGLVVMGDDSCLRGYAFESQRCILAEHNVFDIDLL